MKNPLLQNASPIRVSRGGGWFSNDAWDTRVSFRDWSNASFRSGNRGFRLFRSLEKS